MVHVRKIKEEYLEEIAKGNKPFEVREKDPNKPPFMVGDILALNEILHKEENGETIEQYTGRFLLAEITYILDDSKFCKEDYQIISLAPYESAQFYIRENLHRMNDLWR